MRILVCVLCLCAAACSGRVPESPVSPTAVSETSAQTQAVSGTNLPFHGSFSRDSHAQFEPPITLVISATLTGTATHLGRFTATSEDHVDTTNNTAVGTFILTAANGDRLFTTTEGVEDSFTPPNISTVTLAATITGGTGRFERATGTFTVRLVDNIDFETSSGHGSGSFEGRINLNR
jgi:hypothetical protein